MKIKNFLCEFEKLAPINLALSFDNVGLLVGNVEDEISGIYVSLDVNDEIIEKAKELNVNTIISHHPIIFNPLKKVISSDINGSKISNCLKNGINVISYHTNLDAVNNGINEELVKIMDFKYKNMIILEENKVNNHCGIGRVLTLEQELNINDIVNQIKSKLNIEAVRFIDSGNYNKYKKICIINGSGNSMVKDCYDRDIDLVITGDISYHVAFDAISKGISVLDIGHFNSENMAYKSVMKKFINLISGIDFKVYYDELLCDVYKYI